MGEPARLGHHKIEMIAVDHQVAAAVGTEMDIALGNLDAPKVGAVIFAQKLIVIARYIDHAGAFARLPQELLNHVIVSLGPVPGGPQAPTVDNVTHQIDGIRVVMAQKVEQKFCLAPACTEMHIRYEEGAEVSQAAFSHHVHLMFAESPRILECPYC